jgi:hypothetical protein
LNSTSKVPNDSTSVVVVAVAGVETEADEVDEGGVIVDEVKEEAKEEAEEEPAGDQTSTLKMRRISPPCLEAPSLCLLKSKRPFFVGLPSLLRS